MKNDELLIVLKKVYVWDLLLFIPGALLFAYLPSTNFISIIVNVVIFFFFTVGVLYTKVLIKEHFQ